MEREHKLDAAILERVKYLKGLKMIDPETGREQTFNPLIYQDKNLAKQLEVHPNTIANWRNSGMIPFRNPAPKVYIYMLRDVLDALTKYADDEYNARAEAIHKALDAVAFEERVKQLLDKAERMRKESKSNKNQ